MERYDVVIIGSGLGGLQCGYILAKNGYKVCVLEKNAQIGGCLQTFRRGGHLFDTGFHYVGALGEGESLNHLFSYFGLMDLPWHKLDSDCFDEVVICGESFALANGYENFVESLSRRFPHQQENLKAYVSALKNVGDGIFSIFSPNESGSVYESSLFTRTAYDFLCSTISDPLLRSVLSGASLKLELNPEQLPFYVFAQINDSFIRSAWRLKGGGSLVSDSLAASIRRMGGDVKTKCEVTELVEADGKILGCEVNGSEQIEADLFISDLHPVATLRLVKESSRIRKVYRGRVNSLQNTYGMFTLNLKMKPESFLYLNRNKFIYETKDLWNIAQRAGGENPECLMMSLQVPDEGAFASGVDLLTPMTWEEVSRWYGSKPMQRGAEYEDFKRRKTMSVLAFADKYVHGFSDCVEACYSSTPLTYADYTATERGSAYGIRKDSSHLLQTMLTPRTPVPNLLLTGQNLNLHGILGVSITSFITCAEVLGKVDLNV